MLYTRLSHDGLHKASGHPRLVVDGKDLGFEAMLPVWIGANKVAYKHPKTNHLLTLIIGSMPIAEAFDVVALEGTDDLWVADFRNPPRINSSSGRHIAGMISPAVSRDGAWLSYIDWQSSDTLIVDNGTTRRTLDSGVVWHSWGHCQTLCWQRADGTIKGVSTPDQMPIAATWTGRLCFKPVPVWTGQELWVLLSVEQPGANRADIVLVTWESLLRDDPQGYFLEKNFNGGSAYFHDAVLAVNDGSIRVVYNSDTQAFDRRVNLSTPRESLRGKPPDYPKSVKDLWWGGYFWKTKLYPQVAQFNGNMAVVTDPGGVIDAEAVNTPMLLSAALIATSKKPELVKGLFFINEDNSTELDAECRSKRIEWTKKFPGRDIPACIAYLTPQLTERPGWPPKELDVFSPQFYFEPDNISVLYWVNWWAMRLPTGKLWLPSAQAYDRLTWTAAQMQALAAQVGQWVEASNVASHIWGWLFFAVNRPTGLVTHPELAAALENARIAAGVSKPGKALPSRKPPPVIEEPTMPDAIDVSTIDFLHANIGSWPQTSVLTDVKFESKKLCLPHTKAGKWPVRLLNGKKDEGNPHVFRRVGDRWIGATYEWLEPGQTCKGIYAENIAGHIKKSEFDGWVPAQGELVAFCVATLSRDSARTSNERSQIVLAKWGESGIVQGDGPHVPPPPPPPPGGRRTMIQTIASLSNGKTVCMGDRHHVDPGPRGCPPSLVNRDNFDSPGTWEEGEWQFEIDVWWSVRVRITDDGVIALWCADGDGRGWRGLPNRPDVPRDVVPGDYELWRPERHDNGAVAFFNKGAQAYLKLGKVHADDFEGTMAAVSPTVTPECLFKTRRDFFATDTGGGIVIPPPIIGDGVTWPRELMLRPSADFLAAPIVGSPDPKKSSTLIVFPRPDLLASACQGHADRGYKHIQFYAANEEDFGGFSGFNGYDNPDAYEEMLRRTASEFGLVPDIWLAPDDAKGFHKTSAQRLPGIWDAWLPRMLKWCGGLVVGLEMNEYWSWNEQIRLTNKVISLASGHPVWCHWGQGLWGPEHGKESTFWKEVSAGASGVYYQFTQVERKSNSAFAARTRELVKRMHDRGMRFVASEYAYPGDGASEARARELGRIAMDNGADGFVNGGPAQ